MRQAVESRGLSMYEQHCRAETYKAQNSVGYLIKRAHSMMLDVLEPVLEEHGYSYIQYVILSSLRDGMTVDRKDSVFSSGTTAAHSRGYLINWRNAVCSSGFDAAGIDERLNCSSPQRAEMLQLSAVS
jgi:hypothetical protein